MKIMRPAFIALILAMAYCALIVLRSGNPLVLVTLGEVSAPAELQPYVYSEGGYDGQFVYYIARYGWESTPYLDAPAYRLQRVLLALSGFIAGFISTDAIIWALFAMNVVFLVAGTWALESLLTDLKVSRWYAVGVALSLGMIGAVRLTATETVAYALVLLGILAIHRQQWQWGAFCIGMAALGKEMTLIFALGYGLWWLAQRQWVRVVVGGLLMGVPFVVWQIVLYIRLGSFGIGSGGYGATPFEIIPLMGYIRILTEGGIAAFVILSVILVPFVLLPTFWAFWQCVRERSWSIWTLLLLVNALLMLFVPFSTYREIIGILRFIVGLQIAVILYAAHKRQRRVLRYSTLWAVTTLILISSDLTPQT